MSDVASKAAFVSERLMTNAYRVLRVSADATMSEIHKAAASMRRAVTLGLAATTEADVPLLGNVPRAEADIRTAIGRLQNPVQRMGDRLFWFHLPADSQRATNEASRKEAVLEQREITEKHDQALHGLFDAFEAGVDEAGLSRWVRALHVWYEVVSTDEYWSHVLALEERGGFEPAALGSEIEALRVDAVRLAAEGLVAAGRDALARNDVPTVRRILETLEKLSDTGSWAAIAQEDIAAPAVEGLRELCDAIVDDFNSKIVREQNAAGRNKGLCDAALDRFRERVEPGLQRVIQVLPQHHEAAQWLRERVALCLSGIASHYTWADDFVTSERLYEEALSVARDTPGAIRIEAGLSQIREAARKQRLFGALKPVSSAPSLRTIKGFGFRLYGNSDGNVPKSVGSGDGG